MAAPVRAKSPVIMKKRIPARRQASTVALVSGRGGSKDADHANDCKLVYAIVQQLFLQVLRLRLGDDISINMLSYICIVDLKVISYKCPNSEILSFAYSRSVLGI